MKLLSQLNAREDNKFAAGLAWTIGIFWSTSFGFYFGCICGNDHVFDLSKPLMESSGLPGAAIGLTFGVALALFFTFVYPNWTAEDAREEAEADAHGHH
jgi:hypothetical protein